MSMPLLDDTVLANSSTPPYLMHRGLLHWCFAADRVTLLQVSSVFQGPGPAAPFWALSLSF